MKLDLRKNENPLFLSFALAIVCGLAVALMASAKIMTDPAIRKAELEQTELALKMVLPDFDGIIETEFNGMRIYTAKSGNDVCGYAVLAQGNGYGGPMEALVGFNPDGTIQTYLITKQNETPGIGSRVTTRTEKKTIGDLFHAEKKEKNTLPPNDVLDSYTGKRAKVHRNRETGEPLTLLTGATVSAMAEKDMKPKLLTGATVSSKAVSDIAWRASNTLNIHLEKMKK